VHRFFAPDLDPGNDFVTLPRDEADHLKRVLRLAPGDLVAVFDGRGTEFLGRVDGLAAPGVRVRLLERRQPAAELPFAVTLVQAVLKSDKMDDVVRDATMLGVSSVQPLVTARVEVTVAALLRQGRMDRWTRVAVASVKQCGRATLPFVEPPLTVETWLEEPRPALAVMLVEPSGAGGGEPLEALNDEAVPLSGVAVLAGPEGGWTEGERAAARAAGVRLMTLGRLTLRADRAAIVALSVVQFLWGSR
jgi:16S rRNA (uracil1498-N3)-methyltransferase